MLHAPRITLLVPIACWLLATNCEVAPSERFTPVLDVHGLLLQGESRPHVIVNRTYPIDEPPVIDFQGASIVMARRESTWSFYKDPSYSSCYRCSSLIRIAPSDTLHLKVAHPEFDTVYGSTVVPDTFSILTPLDGDTVTIQDSLVWTRSRSARGYYTSLMRERGGDTFFLYVLVPNESLPGLGYDSLTERLPLYFLNQEPEGELVFRLLALDTNYYNWMLAEGFGLGQNVTDTSSVVGGVGVFGSATVCSVRIYLSKEASDMGIQRCHSALRSRRCRFSGAVLRGIYPAGPAEIPRSFRPAE